MWSVQSLSYKLVWSHQRSRQRAPCNSTGTYLDAAVLDHVVGGRLAGMVCNDVACKDSVLPHVSRIDAASSAHRPSTRNLPCLSVSLASLSHHVDVGHSHSLVTRLPTSWISMLHIPQSLIATRHILSVSTHWHRSFLAQSLVYTNRIDVNLWRECWVARVVRQQSLLHLLVTTTTHPYLTSFVVIALSICHVSLV